MLENSYIAKGFKYGIVFSPYMEENREELFNKSYEEQAEMVKSFSLCPGSGIVEFEDADGLSIREVMEMIDYKTLASTLVFVMYKGFKKESGYLKYVKLFPVFIQCDDENLDTHIDDVIVNYMLDNYSDDKTEYNEMVKCFLQKYKFKTKERTNVKLKENSNRK